LAEETAFETGHFRTFHTSVSSVTLILDWIEQCFTSPPTQYRLYWRRFLQVKRPNQQYQSTGGTNSTQDKSNIQ